MIIKSVSSRIQNGIALCCYKRVPVFKSEWLRNSFLVVNGVKIWLSPFTRI